MAIDKAIILAAGMGVRLGSLTDNIPKCLLEIEGKTILENQLECLKKGGIEETVIVVGYMKDKVIGRVGDHFGSMRVSYVANDVYDRTNNMYSLWLAKEYLVGGSLLLEGDLFFEDAALRRLVASPYENVALLDTFKETMSGSVVTLGADSIIENFILKKEQAAGFDYQGKYKTVNVYKFSDTLGRLISSHMDVAVREGNVNEFYELVLRDIVAGGEAELHGLIIGDLRWFEIDTVEDLEATRELFKQRNRE